MGQGLLRFGKVMPGRVLQGANGFERDSFGSVPDEKTKMIRDFTV